MRVDYIDNKALVTGFGASTFHHHAVADSRSDGSKGTAAGLELPDTVRRLSP